MSIIQRGRFSLLMLSLAYLCSACNASEAQSSGKEAGKKRAVPVVVATATQKTIPIQLSATGTVEAYSTVSVKDEAAIDNAKVQLSYSSIYSPIAGRTGSLKLLLT